MIYFTRLFYNFCSYSGGYGSKAAGGKLPYGKIIFRSTCTWCGILRNCVINNVLHHNDLGYGGLGTGGAGLPGGLGGAGAKPGYPLGTGACFYELTTNRSIGLLICC